MSIGDTLPGPLFIWSSGNQLGVDNLAGSGDTSILSNGIGGPILAEELDAGVVAVGKIAEGLSCPEICFTE